MLYPMQSEAADVSSITFLHVYPISPFTARGLSPLNPHHSRSSSHRIPKLTVWSAPTLRRCLDRDWISSLPVFPLICSGQNSLALADLLRTIRARSTASPSYKELCDPRCGNRCCGEHAPDVTGGAKRILTASCPWLARAHCRYRWPHDEPIRHHGIGLCANNSPVLVFDAADPRPGDHNRPPGSAATPRCRQWR